MNKIVILDGYTIHPNATELTWFQDLGEVSFYDRTPNELVGSRIGDAQYVYTDSTYIGKSVMDQCPHLKWIGILATGLNSVDVAYAKSKGISVCNVPGYGTDPVSQYAFSLLFYACSRLNQHLHYVQEGSWRADQIVPYWDSPFMELAGKTMGIFGFGPIGQRSAKTALALGMKVLVFSNYPDPSFQSDSLKFTNLEEVLSHSHVINLHCPLTESNLGIINKQTIDKMRDGVILINTARGKLIVEDDLNEALVSGKVAFAALDVLAEEPPHPGNPLLTAKNCYITPHVAWTSNDARIRICQIASNNLKEFLAGNLVNCVTL